MRLSMWQEKGCFRAQEMHSGHTAQVEGWILWICWCVLLLKVLSCDRIGLRVATEFIPLGARMQ
jgi:hypothetical protein